MTFPIDGKKWKNVPNHQPDTISDTDSLCVIYYCDTFHWEILVLRSAWCSILWGKSWTNGGSSQPFLAARAGYFFLCLAFEVGTPAGNNYFLWYIIKIHQKLLTRATVQFAPLFSSTNGRPGIKWYKYIDVINGGFFSSPCWIRNSFGIASGIASCRPRCSKWSGGGNLGARRIAG